MNILWSGGVANHSTIIEQINYLVFLRSLSKKDDHAMRIDPEAERVFQGELSQYHWDNLLVLNAEVLFSTLEDIYRRLPELTTDKTIQLLYRDAHVKVFDKPTLRRLVHEIEQLMSDLEKEATTGRNDIFGDMYEYLLSKLAQAGTLGSFRTPRHIINFIVDVIDPDKGETILDPACGTAGFLVAALEHLKEKYSSEEFKKENKHPLDLLSPDERKFLFQHTFTGFDSDFDMFKFGLMNLYLHQLEHPNIKRINTLVDTAGDRTKWDIILANPPFAGAVDQSSISEDLQMGTRATEILFLRYMIDHLSPTGRTGVIVPEGIIFSNTNAHKKIRQLLIETAGLWAVVSLPAGVFNPYSGVKTSILFFDKSIARNIESILFAKVSHDGFDLGASKRLVDKDDLPNALNALLKYHSGLRNKASNAAEAIYILGAEIAHLIPKHKISETGDYNLSGDHYLLSSEYSDAKWPMVSIEELCDLGRGRVINKQDIAKNPGAFPVYSSQTTDDGIFGYLGSYDFDGEYVTWTTDGANAGTVFYRTGKFNCTNVCGTLKAKTKKINMRFLAQALNRIAYKHVIHAGNPKLMNNVMAKITVPLPPLEIQDQIVKELRGYQEIIDGATQIVANWKCKIEIDTTWERVKLKDVCNINPKKIEIKNINPETEVSFVPMADLNQNNANFVIKQTKKLSEVIGSYTYFTENDVLLARVTPCFENGKAGIARKLKNKIGFGSSEYIVIRPSEKILPEIIYCYISEQRFNAAGKIKMTGTGGLQRVPVDFVQNWEISLPPLEVQRQIVDQIDIERTLVDGNKKLIEIYKRKIIDVLSAI
ncbi:MAG: N-6 DNA methylase [Candidatus Berkelbacteria bacterium Gr01-1014_85]|uniref:site-specific DNA-methyltransferase (adenine-specific) n=1 Tax=Candidatus Berkelbacteria bacterium Gr01-1014_85 TaxID=2017150 RepID=A0A554JDI0_9BACT|nr:MAG: N-6 DNA methylase [Candidatus Berkelbacteria bacterium Gr01-1014_85]